MRQTVSQCVSQSFSQSLSQSATYDEVHSPVSTDFKVRGKLIRTPFKFNSEVLCDWAMKYSTI